MVIKPGFVLEGVYMDNIEKMRNGEKIKCPKCKDGYFSAVGDLKTTNVFRCDSCKVAITLTIPLGK